jgi:polyisoprenyl-teichoic acid--peptidoglycan teichoic acid transferase
MLVTRTRLFRRALQALGLLMLTVALTGLSAVYYMGHRWSGRRSFAPVQQTREFIDVAFHPDALFPGQTRLNILCLGLDRDWTDKDLPFSTKSRTDTMIAASLDLLSQQVTALSIPRDMRVEIPGHGFDKINDAYPSGGIDRVLETVNQFLGLRMNYYVLVKLGAVERFVDAIGGITLDVEKAMDYDDNWGQLHIHLQRGVQHLNGEQVEGYMRFRHDAESDFGRMRRQQQALRAVLAKLQSPAVAMRVPRLIDDFNQSIETNLTREQILGLARLFHQVRPEEVVSDALPGRCRMFDGISYLEPEEGARTTLVDWLLRGDETAANRLTTVRVLNGCGDRASAQRVARRLAARQFDVVYAGRARQTEPATRIEGHGRHPDAGPRLLAALPGGKLHWAPGNEAAAVTVIVGQDQVGQEPASLPEFR